MMLWLENFIFQNRTECLFDATKQQQIILLPGMIGPVWMLFGLVRYLRTHQSNYGVTVIPLGLSTSSFEILVNHTVAKITKNLLHKNDIREIILFGHSHGGRVACVVYQELQKQFPHITYSVITAGTPIEKPEYVFRKFRFYLLPVVSKAFRVWPKILQPNKNSMRYVGFYSDYDRIVPSEYSVRGHNGELRMMSGFSHSEFIRATKMGPVMIALLQEIKVS
jgi:hypothetical protein